MLPDSVAVVVRTRPRAVPLAMITMRNQLMGFLFFQYEYGAPPGGPWGRRSSAINKSKAYYPGDMLLISLSGFSRNDVL